MRAAILLLIVAAGLQAKEHKPKPPKSCFVKTGRHTVTVVKCPEKKKK